MIDNSNECLCCKMYKVLCHICKDGNCWVYQSPSVIPTQTNYERLMEEMTIEKMAQMRIRYDDGMMFLGDPPNPHWICDAGEFEEKEDALSAEVAWLNSPVEVRK